MNESDAASTGPDAFIRPYLRAMAGLQRHESLSLDQLKGQAERLLLDTFGPSERSVVARAFPGTVALLGAHTYYFDGFALLLTLPFGAAVAVRPAPEAEAAVVFDAPRRVVPLPVSAEEDLNREDDHPLLARIVASGLSAHGSFQVAVVSTVPRCCADGRLGTLSVAVVQAARDAVGRPEDDAELIREATAAVAAHLARPYGVAPTLGARFAEPRSALAVDTATFEYVALDLPARERLAWALVELGPRAEPAPMLFRRRREAVDEATRRLENTTLTGGRTLRSLEHRHLENALRHLPRRLRPVVRHLVTENRRVQQMIAAIRRADCQMIGGLLLISQASLETDWKEGSDAIRRVIDVGEEQEGLYGGRAVGREFGACALLAGLPFAVGEYVDEVARAAPDGNPPETWLF